MKLNNKGFAVSTFMYMLLLLAIILILATLAILSSRRMILDRQKNIALQNISQNQNPICEAVNGIKSLELGTEYRCEVKDGTFFNFYVLSTQGSKVNLIMDRNICEDGTTNYSNTNNYCNYAWHIDQNNSQLNDNTKGPDTALNVLYNATKSWNSVNNLTFNFEDTGNKENSNYGYVSLKASNGIGVLQQNNGDSVTIGSSQEPLKARLPQVSELTAAGANCVENEEGTCEAWLVQNLENTEIEKYQNNSNIETTLGYWILNSSSESSQQAYSIDSNGFFSSYYASIVGDTGIRPVITLPKSMLK